MKKLSNLIDKAKGAQKKKIVVVEGHDIPVLEAIKEALSYGIIEPILVGNSEKIEKSLKELGIPLNSVEILNAHTPEEAAKNGISLVSKKMGDIVMKGLISTDTFLKAILNKEWGLRTNSILSHVALFEIPSYHKLLLITDAAMNIAPDINQKIHITKNAVNFMKNIVDNKPKVAFLTHNEKVKPGVQASEDAAMLSTMAKRGQLGDILADGPLALDNIISKEAAEHKGIKSEVAGDADIIICPEIMSGNALYKSLTYFAKAKAAALIAGAKAPVVLTSRADSAETKLYSIVFAVVNS